MLSALSKFQSLILSRQDHEGQDWYSHIVPAGRIDSARFCWVESIIMATLLVGLAHPDDEVGAAGTIQAHRARGDRVVVVWLTKGQATGAFGNLSPDEVARRREHHGFRAGEILGVETRFLDFEDTRVMATPDAATKVARLIVELRPDALLTWGDAWVRGMRHPDHQACGQIFRDAVTLARIARVVAPLEPHRERMPVFTFRDVHSRLPAAPVDVSPCLETILELASFYRRRIGFGNRDWILSRLQIEARPFGLQYAEVFDAWEEVPVSNKALLPTEALGLPKHPDREDLDLTDDTP
jgi:LmbE family N-acetylglucosaminyl deacetylase